MAELQLDYEMLGQLMVNQIRAKAPKVTGNLARNIRFNGVGFGDVWGHITIDVPYASFVNYGKIVHPNSKKLSKDYLFVEKSIKQVLKIALERYGGQVK